MADAPKLPPAGLMAQQRAESARRAAEAAETGASAEHGAPPTKTDTTTATKKAEPSWGSKALNALTNWNASKK